MVTVKSRNGYRSKIVVSNRILVKRVAVFGVSNQQTGENEREDCVAEQFSFSCEIICDFRFYLQMAQLQITYIVMMIQESGMEHNKHKAKYGI